MSYKIDINSEVTCPYVSSHKVKASKLQAHLVKCAQSNPTIARLYETCPFNFTHKVLGVNLPAHISQCPDKFSTMSHLMRPTNPNACDVSVPIYSSSNKPSAQNGDDDEEDWNESAFSDLARSYVQSPQ